MWTKKAYFLFFVLRCIHLGQKLFTLVFRKTYSIGGDANWESWQKASKALRRRNRIFTKTNRGVLYTCFQFFIWRSIVAFWELQIYNIHLQIYHVRFSLLKMLSKAYVTFFSSLMFIFDLRSKRNVKDGVRNSIDKHARWCAELSSMCTSGSNQKWNKVRVREH